MSGVSSKEQALKVKMARAGILEKDILESFIHASGPGGQNVNKLSSCVQLKHGPTGITVKCQKERSLSLNRCQARVLLIKKIELIAIATKQKEIQRIEKLRRKNRKRSLKAKEKILEQKFHRSEKKQRRQKIRINKEDF